MVADVHTVFSCASNFWREIAILQGFYQQQAAYRLAGVGVDAKTITRTYQSLRGALFHVSEPNGAESSGEIELDESHFGGVRKG